MRPPRCARLLLILLTPATLTAQARGPGKGLRGLGEVIGWKVPSDGTGAVQGFARAHEPLTSGRYLEAARTFREVLSSRGAQGYSIQLGRHWEAGPVTDQLQESGVPPQLVILRLAVGNRPCWGPYWGVFRSMADARAGQEQVPPALRQPGPTPVAISRLLAQAY